MTLAAAPGGPGFTMASGMGSIDFPTRPLQYAAAGLRPPAQAEHLRELEEMLGESERSPEGAFPPPIEVRPPRPYPEATYLPSADLLLTDRANEILAEMLPFLKRQALWRFVPVSSVVIHGFVNPEDRTEELIVTQWVALSPREALDYWDRLAFALRAWGNRFPEHPTNVALDQISVEVRWQEHVDI